jgi:hypothetical protein
LNKRSAQGLKHKGEVVEARRRVRMIGAEHHWRVPADLPERHAYDLACDGANIRVSI